MGGDGRVGGVWWQRGRGLLIGVDFLLGTRTRRRRGERDGKRATLVQDGTGHRKCQVSLAQDFTCSWNAWSIVAEMGMYMRTHLPMTEG